MDDYKQEKVIRKKEKDVEGQEDDGKRKEKQQLRELRP